MARMAATIWTEGRHGGQSSGGESEGLLRANRGRNVCEGVVEGGRAPFQSFGDHAKAALLSEYLSLLGRGHSAKPGVTQGPETVEGKEQSRNSASRRGRAGHVIPGAARGGGHSRNDRFFLHDYGLFTTPS